MNDREGWMSSEREQHPEAWVFLIVAVVAMVAVGAGLAWWARSTSSRMIAEARDAQAAAARSAVTQMRDAERAARAAEPPEEIPAEYAPGRAMDLNRVLRTAIDAMDTPERREQTRRLLDGAMVEVESGRL